MSKKTLRLWSVLLSVFLIVSMVPTMVFAGSEDQVEIVTQPENITAQAGEEKTLSVVAENATSYQWQRSSDNGQNWSNIGSTNSNYTNAKTDTMTVKVNKTTAGFVYKCVVKNSAGSVSTEIVSVTLLQQLEITAQPNNITGISGDEKVMKVTATNASSYQWQRSSDDGESWSNIGSSNVNYSNAKTAALTIKINKNTAGFVYRCVVKNSENTVNSEAATVTVILPVVIKADPKDISAPSGEQKTMSVVAENATSYQWQRSSDNGDNWSNIGSTNSNYTNAKTDTLTVKVNKTTAGFVYRCVVKNSAFTEYTKEASVTVAEPAQPLEIREQPQSISGTNGSSKRITVVVDNATSYQWQRSADGESWSNISTTNSNYSGVKTQTVTVKINKNTAAYVYRCVVKNADSSVTTDVVTVSLSLSMDITEQPESISGKSGDEKTMSVAATNATSYQWQRSSDDGATWSNIGTTNSNYSGVKTEELSVKINKNTAAYIYRCVVKNDSGDSLASEVVCVELKATVTLTLDANGGLIYGDPTVTRIKEQNSYFFNDTEDAPVREGYVFDGWCLDKDGLEPIGFSCLVTEDLTLYARWIKGDRCTVTVNANGGEFSSGEQIYSVAVDKESYIYAYISYDTIGKVVLEEPTRAGYVFDGWYLDADCSTPMGYSYFVTEDLTIYASWKEAYTVTFNANGGQFYNGEQTNPVAVAKNSYIGSYSEPARDGWVFVDWCLDAACERPIYIWDTLITSDLTVYAKWAEAVTITFDANGGDFYYGNQTYSEDFAKGDLVLSYSLPRKDGLVFEDWYLDAACTRLVDTTEYIVTENVTFYAKYCNPIYITWDANGGMLFITDEEYSTFTEAIGKHEGINDRFDVSREGYVFDGWYFDEACTEPADPRNYTDYADVTFYAKWIEEVTVTWDANGGCYEDGGLIYCQPIGQGSCIGYVAYTPIPSRDGYVIDGWYLDAALTEKVDLYEYVADGDVTFYAGWIEAVNVTWDANGGIVCGESVYVEKAAKNSVLGYYWEADRDGYVMEGWYLDAACTERVDPQTYQLTEDVTFYAKWEIPAYVTWDANGGFFFAGPTYTEGLVKDRAIGYYRTPDRENYVFVGWYFDAACTEPADPQNYIVSADVTFYAKWDVPVYITWNGNGGYIWGDLERPNYIEAVAKDSVLGYSQTVERENYVLVGWYFDADCTSRVDIQNYVVTGDVTFYAKWAEAACVTWDFGDLANETMTSNVAKNSTVPSSPYIEIEGFLLDGWCLDPECTEEINVFEYVVEGDITFYAKWVEAINVTWEANGGFFDCYSETSTITTQIPRNGIAAYDYSIPEREGWIFDGWCLDADCTEDVDIWEYTVTKEETFYAKWTEAVNVTWNGNGGLIWGDEYFPTYTELLRKNAEIGYSMSAERNGFVLDGWYFDEQCTQEADPQHYSPDKDVTFYAKWSKEVIVTWDGNGGYIWGDEDYPTYTYQLVANRTINYVLSAERENYSFEGWYLDPEYENKVDFDEYVLSDNVTFYAKWIELVTITWDGNGGYLWGNEDLLIDSYQVKKGEKISDNYLIAWAYNPGQSFDGWYYDRECTRPVDIDEYVATEDITFYAKLSDIQLEY